MYLSIMDTIQGYADSFKEWVIENGTNPIFYIGLFFIGILLFVIASRALNKK